MKLFAFHCGGEVTDMAVFDPFDPTVGHKLAMPYFFYVIRFLDPSNILARIKEQITAEVEQTLKGRVQARTVHGKAPYAGAA